MSYSRTDGIASLLVGLALVLAPSGTTSAASGDAAGLVVRLTDTVNPGDFGALCNGRSDDSPAFARALSAGGVNARLMVPAGEVCLVGSTVTLTLPGQQILCGKGATLRAAASGIFVVHLKGRREAVEGCRIEGGGLAAVGVLVTGRQNRVERNTITRARDHAIAVDGATGNCGGNLVHANEVSDSGQVGIANWKCDRGRIIGNYVHENGAEGITYDDSSNGTIRGNRVIGNKGGTGGIGVDRTVSTTISDNLISGNAVAGVAVNNQVGDSKNGTITGNILLDNGPIAQIHLHSCTSKGRPIAPCKGAFMTEGWIVLHNKSDGHAHFIVIDAGSRDNKVAGNVMGTATNFVDRGRGNVFSDND